MALRFWTPFLDGRGMGVSILGGYLKLWGIAAIGNSYNSLVKRNFNRVRISRYGMIDFQDKILLSARRWAFGFSTNLTSTNLESKRYVYPVCPTAGGHPSSLIQISKFKWKAHDCANRGPESASTLSPGLSRRIWWLSYSVPKWFGLNGSFFFFEFGGAYSISLSEVSFFSKIG